MINLVARFLSDLPRSTWLLTLAQAINLTCAVISVTVAALVGAQLAPTPALGTVPYGAQFAAVMVCTYPASMLMRRLGRRAVFVVASLFLITAGISGFVAVEGHNFSGLILAHILLGIYIACANFYRFAAVDSLDARVKPKAISLVVAGGVLAAVIGPILVRGLHQASGFAEFSLCYASFCVLGALTLALMAYWKPGVTVMTSVDPDLANRPIKATWSGPISVAVFCSAGGYFLMNLLMVQSSLVMKDISSFAATSHAIQVHVLAMFAPSFFTGSLIARIGLRQTLILGFLLLLGATLFGMMAIRYDYIFIALILVGLGWNFSYVGGGALLAQSVNDETRHRWQGINDTLIAACATLGAFLPAPMLAGAGWNGTNMIVMPMCVLGIVMIWYVLVDSKKNAAKQSYPEQSK